MVRTKGHQFVRDRLAEVLEPVFEGIEIDVGRSQRWKRTVLTFRHRAFADLLPEQRFRRLVQLIPPDFYEKHLRGAVWFELAPGETEDDLMQAKRSEDVVGDEPRIARRLLRAGFFEALEGQAGESPIETCGGDFEVTRKVLTAKKIIGDQQRDACLVFVHNQAYCDCEVLLAARPALVERYRPGRRAR